MPPWRCCKRRWRTRRIIHIDHNRRLKLWTRHSVPTSTTATAARPTPTPTPTPAPDRRSVEGVCADSTKVKALRDYCHACGLCFKCGERWGRDHTCPTMVQLHVVEELLSCSASMRCSTSKLFQTKIRGATQPWKSLAMLSPVVPHHVRLNCTHGFKAERCSCWRTLAVRRHSSTSNWLPHLLASFLWCNWVESRSQAAVNCAVIPRFHNVSGFHKGMNSRLI